jgi:hypothetical protein
MLAQTLFHNNLQPRIIKSEIDIIIIKMKIGYSLVYTYTVYQKSSWFVI